MAIELQPVGEEALPAEAPEETQEAPETEAAPEAEVPVAASEPAPKRRGRPPGAKNKPKAPAHVVPEPAAPSTSEASESSPPAPKRKAKAAPRRPRVHVEPEAEVYTTPPPSPRTAKRLAWQEYSQRRADEHRARVDAWSTRLDRLLAY